MLCPNCKKDLSEYKDRRIAMYQCYRCGGFWFPFGTLGEFLDISVKENPNIPEEKLDLERKEDTYREVHKDEKSFLCPVENKLMEPFNYAADSNIIVYRCESCEGIWASKEQVSDLLSFHKGGKAVDTFAKAFGEEIGEEAREEQTIKDVSSVFSNPAFILFPVILPLEEETKINIFPAVTIIIIAINVCVFLYQIFFISNIDFYFQFWGLVPAVVFSQGKYYQFLSAIFIHEGFFHLFGNMFYLWIFGPHIEKHIKPLKFFSFYILMGIISSAVYIDFHPSSYIPLIGASGAISGIMGAYFIFYPKVKIKTLFVSKIIEIPAYVYLGLWVLLQFHSIGSSVAWLAHIAGFIFGAVIAWIYKIRKRIILTQKQVGDTVN